MLPSIGGPTEQRTKLTCSADSLQNDPYPTQNSTFLGQFVCVTADASRLNPLKSDRIGGVCVSSEKQAGALPFYIFIFRFLKSHLAPLGERL